MIKGADMRNSLTLFLLGFLAGCGGAHAVHSEFNTFVNNCDKATISYRETGPAQRRVFVVICRQMKGPI